LLYPNKKAATPKQVAARLSNSLTSRNIKIFLDPYNLIFYFLLDLSQNILIVKGFFCKEIMEPHGQSPWFPRDTHKGRTSRTRGPIHPRV